MSKAKTEVARLIVSKIYYMKKLTFTSTNALIPRFSFLRFCFLSLIDFTSYSVFGSSVNDGLQVKDTLLFSRPAPF